MSRRPVHLSLTKKAVFAAVILALIPMIAELGLRAVSAATQRVRIFQRHPVAGYACKPSLVNVEKRWDAHNTFRYSTDIHGFRITAPPTANRLEPPILLVGDSFAFGWCVDDESSLGYLLSDRTHRRVINLSCIGYGPDVSLALLRWYFEQPDVRSPLKKGDRHPRNRRPETGGWRGREPVPVFQRAARPGGDVVLLVCENDFMDILTRRKSNRAKPFCTLSDDGFQTRKPELSWVDRAIDTSDLAYTVLTRLLPPRIRTGVRTSDSPRLMCRILSEIRSLCERNGVHLNILFFSLLEGSTLRPDVKNAFFELCHREGIEVADITREITGSGSQGRRLLAVDGIHWNRRGNQRVAAIIHHRLEPHRTIR